MTDLPPAPRADSHSNRDPRFVETEAALRALLDGAIAAKQPIHIEPAADGVVFSIAGGPTLEFLGNRGDEAWTAVRAVFGRNLRLSSDRPTAGIRRSVALGAGRFAKISETTAPGPFGDVVLVMAEAGNGRFGVTVRKLQPFTNEDERLLRLMLQDCDDVTLCIGSAQRGTAMGHPFDWSQRKDMAQTAVGAEIRVLPLADQNFLDDVDDWGAHVLERIRARKAPKPTDCYAASMADAKWYAAAFADPKKHPVVRDDADATTYENPETRRRLHVLKRRGDALAAADVRSLIERRDDDWKDAVPAAVHAYIERHYPGELRVALKAEGKFPENAPFGTSVVRTDYDPPLRFKRMGDGRWNEIRPSRGAIAAFELGRDYAELDGEPASLASPKARGLE